jgi:L-lactate dehydrogenase complex protein LldF
MGQALGHRAERVAEVPEWEALRDAARDLRRHGLTRLPEMVEQFTDQLTARGAKVYFASDAADANRLIADLLRAQGVTRFVKGKSMTTEETKLNHALQAEGFDPVETDLGEYLVQLGGDTPAHPTAPAVHYSRQDCGKLICDYLGVPYTDDPQTLTLLVRDDLRQEFLKSPVGITSANFAVAETGTLVIVDNEGNQGLTSALPDVHIALVGIDKLVPRLRDLGTLLRLLARNSTGQTQTCYTTLISGPRQATDVDGPRELHVILLDNGRSRLLADPETRVGLTCMRCGVCCNICPIYSKVGGQAYGWTYPGAIGCIWGPFLQGEDWSNELPFISTLCGACGELCPVRIELPHHLGRLRARPAATRRFPWFERLGMGLMSRVLATPGLYRLATRLLRWGYPLRGLARWLPLAQGWVQGRELPRPAPRSFQQSDPGGPRS